MKGTTKSGTEVFTIGNIAKRAGVGVETVRFYEREGLIEKPRRRESGYREYSNEVISRIRFIRRAQELGFSLREILEFLSLRMERSGTCAQVKKRAEMKISDIEKKISDLLRMKKALKELTEACIEQNPIAGCPILKAFERDGG